MRYYTALPPRGGDAPIYKLMDYLAFNGYIVKSKQVSEFDNGDGDIRRKGNMDVEMAVDTMALLPRMKRLILCSGDGDFCALVDAVQNVGVHVTAVSTVDVTASALRRQVNRYLDIRDVAELRRSAVDGHR